MERPAVAALYPELTALVFGLLTLIGMVALINRRLVDAKIRALTSVMDWIMFAVLLFQVGSGVYVAVFHPWGSTWYATVAVPYLRSISVLSPDTATVTQLPLAAQLHLINAFLLIGLFPFTRLVHILVVPNPYLCPSRKSSGGMILDKEMAGKDD